MHKSKAILGIILFLAISAIGLSLLGISTQSLLTSSVDEFIPIECGSTDGSSYLPGCEHAALKRTFNKAGDKIEAGAGDSSYIEKTIVPNFVAWFIGFMSGICIIIIMIGGFKWIIALGDNTETANRTVIYGVVGLIVALLSYITINILNNLPTFVKPKTSFIETTYAKETSKTLEDLLPLPPIQDEDGEEGVGLRQRYAESARIDQFVVPWIIDLLLRITGTIALAIGLYGAYQIASAGGEAEKRKKGILTILYAIIGMLIISLAYVTVWSIGQINFGTV